MFLDEALVLVRPIWLSATVFLDPSFRGLFFGFRDGVLDPQLFFEGLDFCLCLRLLRIVFSDELQHAYTFLDRTFITYRLIFLAQV